MCKQIHNGITILLRKTATMSLIILFMWNLNSVMCGYGKTLILSFVYDLFKVVLVLVACIHSTRTWKTYLLFREKILFGFINNGLFEQFRMCLKGVHNADA